MGVDNGEIAMKKSIKIKFIDFYKGFDEKNNDFIEILSKKYDIVYSDNPDYLFYSCFGYEHLKYSCIRIFFTGECITPDFNECDYAIGFDRLQFGDRYVRVPLYKLFQYKQEYYDLIGRATFSVSDLAKKEGFCSFVYSNCFAQDKRTEMFTKLSQYKQVSSGGRYLNNIGGAVRDKKEFQSKHKFAIAFENSVYDGYATEKLMEAFAARTIPIYYGDPRVTLDFNPKAFINCSDYSSLDEVVEVVKKIDSNDELYLQIINEPVITNNVSDDSLERFLYQIFDQDQGRAFRRPFSAHPLSAESMKLRHAFFETRIYDNLKRIRNQVLRLKKGTMLSRKRTK